MRRDEMCTNQSALGSGAIAAHGGMSIPALSSRSWTAWSNELIRTVFGEHCAWYALNVVATRPSSGWCHWQAQQAERSEKVTEDEQQELAGGSSEVCGPADVDVVVFVVVVVLVALPVDASVGQRKLRSRNGSEAEGVQTWRTRWTTWPAHYIRACGQRSGRRRR